MIRPLAAPAKLASPFLMLIFAACVAFGAHAQEEKPADANRPSAEAKPTDADKSLSNLVGHGGPVKSVTIGADSKKALTGSFDYSMILWDISAQPPKILKRFDDHDGAVNVVRFLPDGERAISAGDDGQVSFWDLKSGRRLHLFEGHTAKIVDLSLSPDGGTAVTASWDRTVRVWDLEAMKAGPVLRGHKGPVNAAVISEFNNRPVIYTASYDGTVRRWAYATGKFERKVYSHGWGLNVLKALKGGEQLVFGSLNGARGVIDPVEGELIKKLPRLENPILSMAVDRNELFVAFGSAGGKIQVYTASNWTIVEEHQNPYGPIWAMDFAKYGVQIYYGGLDDFAIMWQVAPRKPFEPLSSRFPRRFQRSNNLSLGERQFARKCSVCHTLTKYGANRAGPTLFGVFGRRAGTLPGYSYSSALKNSDIIWDERTIERLFEVGPEHFTPGTKMPLQKIADAKIRGALLEFLKEATVEDGRREPANPGQEEKTHNRQGEK